MIRLVSEEGVLFASLPAGSRFQLPLASPDLLHSSDRAIATAGSSRFRCCPSWRNDDFRIPRFHGVVDRDRVVGGVGCENFDVIPNRVEEIESSLPIAASCWRCRVKRIAWIFKLVLIWVALALTGFVHVTKASPEDQADSKAPVRESRHRDQDTSQGHSAQREVELYREELSQCPWLASYPLVDPAQMSLAELDSLREVISFHGNALETALAWDKLLAGNSNSDDFAKKLVDFVAKRAFPIDSGNPEAVQS